MIFQGNSVKKHDVLLSPSNLWQRISVLVVAVPSRMNGWVFSMFLLTRFVWLFFRLVKNSLSFRRSMSGAALVSLLENIAKYHRWSSPSGSSPAKKVPYLGGSRTVESTFGLCFCDLCPTVRLQKGVCPIRLVGHKMFLHLVLGDLADRFANSVWVQPVAFMELSVPFGIPRPSSSCIPLFSMHLVVCRRGR